MSNINAAPKLTVIITNNADNTGLTGSFDRNEIVENNTPRHITANALVVTAASSSGAPAKIRVVGQTGVTYVQPLPDHATDRQSAPDGTLTQDAQGKYTTAIAFDISNMMHGATEIITIRYYLYLDVFYYARNGAPNSEALASVSINFQISS